jgi:hypothetical protein
MGRVDEEKECVKKEEKANIVKDLNVVYQI